MSPTGLEPLAESLFPELRFGGDFLKRLESFVPRISSSREKVEGSGRSSLASGGEEFVGYRPYRPGEDLRQLDWNLLARLDKPFVRTTRREASESWSILLDASASMAVGPPGKFQLAGEVTVALARLGLRRGARVRVRVARAESTADVVVHRPQALPELMSALEGLRAEGAGDFTAHLRTVDGGAGAGRMFAISDFGDVEPASLLALGSRGRSLCAVQLLAPHELQPRPGDWVEWTDPESREQVRVHLEPGLVRDYERRLEAWLGGWRDSCARHRIPYGVWSSDTPFETLLTELFTP